MGQEQTAKGKNERKYKTILIIIWVIALMITLIGATFAYFMFTKKSEPQIIITGDYIGEDQDDDGNSGNDNNGGGQNSSGSGENASSNNGTGNQGGSGGGNQTVSPTESLNMSVTVEGTSRADNIKPTKWDESMAKNESNQDIAVIPFRVSSNSTKNAEYRVNMSTYIEENELLEGGSAQDIKYRVYKGDKEISSGNFHTGDFDVEIVNGIIEENKNLLDEYKLYVYIDETHVPQNRLQSISFSIILTGYVNQK